MDPENLRLAFWKAARGKRDRSAVRAFRDHLADELRRMRTGILGVDYPVGQYQRFIVHDPKERVIHAAGFPERVLHHDTGWRPNGLESRDAGRQLKQLERQRQELPVCERGQEQPGEQEQQSRPPPGPSSGQGRMASRN